MSKKQLRGLALLEVIVALTVFSLVVLGLVRAFTQSLSTARLGDHVSQAVSGLNNHLAIVLADQTKLGDYDLDDDDSGIRFHLRAEPGTLSSQQGKPLKNLIRVTITASWTDNANDYSREISFLKYQP